MDRADATSLEFSEKLLIRLLRQAWPRRANMAVQVLLNGNALHRRHAFDTWTVAGMLDTIALDIEHCERWEQGRAAPGTCDLMINGTFDETTGIPRKYIRMELGRPNSIGVMDWKITRFTPTDKAVLRN